MDRESMESRQYDASSLPVFSDELKITPALVGWAMGILAIIFKI